MAQPRFYTYLDRVQIEFPGGRNDSFWVTHTSYGKESIYTEDSPSPYLIPNELVSACIGSYLRLPIPPFALMQGATDEWPMFTNLQFTPNEDPPPDALAAKCWEAAPELCTGIALFDILIGNDDRRPRHIAVDKPDRPTTFLIFDHDCAIASDMLDGAVQRFKTRKSDFLAEYHCLIPLIDNDQYFSDWIGRIESIPPWFIDDVCDEARTAGFRKKESREAAKFLKWRSKYIADLIQNHSGQFLALDGKWSAIL